MPFGKWWGNVGNALHKALDTKGQRERLGWRPLTEEEREENREAILWSKCTDPSCARCTWENTIETPWEDRPRECTGGR